MQLEETLTLADSRLQEGRGRRLRRAGRSLDSGIPLWKVRRAEAPDDTLDGRQKQAAKAEWS